MKLSHAQMYGRLLAGDPAYDGRFFTGVRTTGIYCLPSCRARKPKAENVDFFPSVEAARAAGFRACRKCHPDDYARGVDRLLEDMEQLVAEIRNDPAAFADVRAVVRRSGYGASRLFELVRHHYHDTPAGLLDRARLEFAKGRLESHPNAGVLDVALAAGYESISVFHQHFRLQEGLTPGEYRDLAKNAVYTLQLPTGYAVPYLKRALSRDAGSATERLDGNRYVTFLRLRSAPVRLELRLQENQVQVEYRAVGADSANVAAVAREVQACVVRLLGLRQDVSGFVRLVSKLGFRRLVAGRETMRYSQLATPFEALLWAVIGQQINLSFARALRNRLITLAGEPTEEGLYLPPSPERLAELSAEALMPLQFSRQKARYVIDLARAVASGNLPLDRLADGSATRAQRELMNQTGLGPWSSHYIMMRGFGFADCVPLGDTGVTSGLQALMKLDQRPDIDVTRRLMAVFSPYRSLATAHLWQLPLPAPSEVAPSS